MKTSFWIALNISLLVLLVSVCLVIGDVGQVTVNSIRRVFNKGHSRKNTAGLHFINLTVGLTHQVMKTSERTEKLSIRPENTEVYKQWIQPDQVWLRNFRRKFACKAFWKTNPRLPSYFGTNGRIQMLIFIYGMSQMLMRF